MIEFYVIALVFSLISIIFRLTYKNKKVIIYSTKRYVKTKKTFLFSKNLVGKNENGLIFYAETGGCICFIFDKNSWICLKIRSKKLTTNNANNAFIRGNCSQNRNAYYIINKLHSTVNFDCELSILINNVNYEWNSGSNVLKFRLRQKSYCVFLSGEFVLDSSSRNELVFNVKNVLIDYSTCDFKKMCAQEKKDFLDDYFSYVCTNNWENVSMFTKFLSSEDSLEKRYFQALIETKSINTIVGLNHFAYAELRLSSTIFIVNSKNFRIDLLNLGLNSIISLKIKNNIIKLCCLKTGFVFFLRFGKRVKHSHLGCVLGKLWLYVSLEGIATCEIYPFSLNFDVNIFNNTCIKKFTSSELSYKYLNSSNAFSLSNILYILNNQIVCGNLTVFENVMNLFFENLNEECKFAYANLLLSWACVGGKSLSHKQQRIVLGELKQLKIRKKSEVYCFLNKLLKLVNDANLKQFISKIIDNYYVLDKSNFEFVFCYLLGIEIRNECLSVKNSLIKYDAELKIKDKQVNIVNSQINALVIDGIEHINRDSSVNLQSLNNRVITFQCSSGKN